jgi:hypothetical protein
MPDTVRVDQIVDSSAAIAAGITGVTAVWGVGSGGIIIPAGVAAGSLVLPAPSNVTAPGVHVSDMPPAPGILYRSATVCEITWEIPMRIYLSANDEANARRVAAPFYRRYIEAFAAHTQILGTVNSGLIASVRLFEEDATWYGIQFTLRAIERLDLELQA